MDNFYSPVNNTKILKLSKIFKSALYIYYSFKLKGASCNFYIEK